MEISDYLNISTAPEGGPETKKRYTLKNKKKKIKIKIINL